MTRAILMRRLDDIVRASRAITEKGTFTVRFSQ